MQKKSIFKTIIKVLIILFILYNIVWLCFYFFYYRSFANKIKSDDIDDIKYTYSVDPPYYLGFVFNLGITETRRITKEGQDISDLTTDLIIWPKLMRDDEYGIMIYYVANIDRENKEIGVDYIMVDSKGNPLNVLNEEEQKHYTAQKDSIKKIMKLAKEKWGI